jgi:23S rRNA maturation-related 3'-5' exoribonuclease YhaM
MTGIEELMIKYPNFNIVYVYDENSLQPKTIITDNINNKTYEMKTLWNWGKNNIEEFIQQIIVKTRNQKINNIIEPKS